MKKLLFGMSLALATVAGANTVYVSDTYGDDTTGTGTLEKPMKTIHAGINKLDGWGSALVISNGTYKLDETIDLAGEGAPNNITVRSFSNNPADVIIDGQNKVQCLKCGGYNKYFYGLTFQNGSSTTAGAGIYMSGATWIVSNCVVRNCHAVSTSGLRGGGLYANRDLKLMDTKFFDCSAESTASAEGGGFLIGYHYNEGSETVSTIKDVVVSNCFVRGTSSTQGGGVSINRANVNGLVVMDCRSLNGQASPTSLQGSGGGVFKRTYIETTFENVLITNCLANATGGGLWGMGSSDGLLHVRNCSFVGNRIEAVPSNLNATGGGAKLDSAAYDISHCRIADNRIVTTASSTGHAPCLYLSGAGATVADCVFSGNVTVKGTGGGLYCMAPLTVSNCVIAANSASTGGAFQLDNCDGALLTDVFCISNTAISYSLGRIDATAKKKPVTIRNSYFTGHGGETGQWASSLMVRTTAADSPVSFEYCTFVSNMVNSMQTYVLAPSVSNPGVTTEVNASVSNLYVKGCVFSSNSGKSAFPKCMNSVTNITYTYADTFPATWWTSVSALHNYDKAMMPNAAVPFVDAASGDYRLKRGTPFIDGGVQEAWMGTGRRKGPLDMGDGSYTVEKAGPFGVSVVRNNALPRVRGGSIDYGCFEFDKRTGFAIFFR